MKKSFIILIFGMLWLSSCKQKTNQIIFDMAANQEILYGYASIDVFQNDLFSKWYSPQYNDYVVNIDYLDSLSLLFDDVAIKIVLGTWCGDSRREVPRFLRILEESKFPMDRVEIIGVDRTKTCPDAGVEKGFVDFVPTFIVYKQGVELGRIIEHPIDLLEIDLFRILSE